MRNPTTHAAELRRQLRRHGVWGGRASRLIEEWGDHVLENAARRVADGTPPEEAEAEAWRALGDPATLAASAARELAAGSWLGRHPWLGGIVLPLTVWLAVLAGIFFAGAWLAGFLGEDSQPLVDDATLELWWPLTFHWLPWMCAMAWLVRIAYRMPGGWKLYWITAAALTLCSTSPCIHLSHPLHDPGTAGYMVGSAGLGGPLGTLLYIPISFIWDKLPRVSAPVLAQGHLWIQALLMAGPAIALRSWARSRDATAARQTAR